ncbi:hypothetical protein [Chromobacterium aquaticum]|uniref:Lipoprotein n=1 Tax=Chromobacterium aquaticum TaxID=467180 RepID=A0ABV8ZNE8_9NEIS|nr:hypothetical protein [Chromobacterium aquaticum]MCD5360788.1 hypothetical protein [Chromobacterium aquaticum]
MPLTPRHWLLASACALMLGCASTPGSDRCAGQTQPTLPGMAAVDNPDLLNSALGQPGKGGLCAGQVRRQEPADQTVTVYRVYDNNKVNSRLGRWWSFSQPRGPVAAYRAANAICPSWSQLNRVVRCQLKVGAQVAVGPGQSADCAPDANYPPSAVNQVYIPNSGPDTLWVEQCQDMGDFPPTS